MVFNQKAVPIVEAISSYITKSNVSFHTPGHKGGGGIERTLASLVGPDFFKADLTELPGLDDLHMPTGCIKHAQMLAAEAYGADKTHFLVNGSSVGIQAALMACCREGDICLLPRNAHRSAIAGLILSGAQPLWLTPQFDKQFNVPLFPNVNEILQIIKGHQDLKSIFWINPNYHGFCGDMESVIEIAKKEEIIIIVDEAHGPHLHFHPELPKSAVDLGADVVIQSTHKMLAGVNQGAMLHIAKNAKVSTQEVSRQLTLLQTTSPSYPILASLDTARMQMATKGRELITKSIEMAKEAQRRIDSIKGLVCAKTNDPCKILVSVEGLGITGYDAADYLRRHHQVQLEMADFNNVLAMITFGNSPEECQQLVLGFESLSRACDHMQRVEKKQPKNLPVHQPTVVLTPRTAWLAPKKMIKLREAVGEVCAEIIAPYPPGIPLLCPGEVISREVIEQLKEIKGYGSLFQGNSDPQLKEICIVRELRRT